jgi:hypothetical protein
MNEEKPEITRGKPFGFTLALAMATGVFFSLESLSIFSLPALASGLLLGLVGVERAMPRPRPDASTYVALALGSGAIHALAVVLAAALQRYLFSA